MTREQYRKARELIRANGPYALHWLSADHAQIMRALAAQQWDILTGRARLEKHPVSRLRLFPLCGYIR